jgi:nucleoside-diphosphate-sugar epimerase
MVLVGRGGLEREVRSALREHGNHVLVALADDDRGSAAEVDALLDLGEPTAMSAAVSPASRATTAQRLLQDFRERAGRYVFVSSVLVYAPVSSPARWPIQEHHLRLAHGDPASRAYGQDCIDAEDLITQEWCAPGLSYAILRPTVLYGSATANVSSLLLDEARRQPWAAARRFAAAGVMQWVDVRDAARAVVLAATAPTVDKDRVTIAGADAFTAPDLVQALWQGPEWLDDAWPLKFDIDRAAVELGWRPEHRIGDQVAMTGQRGSAPFRVPGPDAAPRWQPGTGRLGLTACGLSTAWPP